DTHNRINMKPVDPELGLVERSDLVRGYQYEPDEYVIIEDEDLEAVRIEANHTLNIEAFVNADSVQPIYQDTPYYLAPDGALREAMRQAKMLASARLLMSNRERVGTIGAYDKGMMVETLRMANEVRSTTAYFEDSPQTKADPEMLALAEKLIEQKVTEFDIK